MAFQNEMIDDLLYHVRRALNGVEQMAEIKTALSQNGFGPERLAEGLALFNQVTTLVEKQQKYYQKQYDLTEILTTTRELLDDLFGLHRHLLRLDLSDDLKALRQLGLNVKRSARFSVWLNQGKQFYGELRTDETLQPLAAKYNLDEAALTDILTRLDNLRPLSDQQAQAKGRAQTSTKERDAAVTKLKRWYSAFKKVARYALRSQSQLLEALGLGPVK